MFLIRLENFILIDFNVQKKRENISSVIDSLSMARDPTHSEQYQTDWWNDRKYIIICFVLIDNK